MDEEGCNEEQALAIIETALARGIRYFDTAWIYSKGQSERRLGLVAGRRRSEMWIATKTWDATRDGARRQLEESLTRLQTDHVDEWRLHNVWDMARLDAMTGRGGALEAAVFAQEEGLVRFISISGHSNPQVQIEALRRYPFDTVLVAASVLDHFIYSFAEEFLPAAQQRQVGVVGMKVFGLRVLAHVAERALRYSLALPLTTMIVGCSTLAQLEADLAVAETFTPLSGAERLELFREVLPLVQPQNMPWKTRDWAKPSEWKPRQEPAGRSECGIRMCITTPGVGRYSRIGGSVPMDIKQVNGTDRGKVFVYALSTCVWCKKTKTFLSELGVAYSYVDVDQVPMNEEDEVEREVEKWNPSRSFPTVVINDSTVIVGFKPDELKKTLGV